jgi:hypothetical protein
MSTLWYTTLEAVGTATDAPATARNDAQVRRALTSGARAVEGQLRRTFRPWTGTRTITRLSNRPVWQLPLGRHELISVTSIVVAGVTLDPADYDLISAPGTPEDDGGPPYNRIDLVDQAAWGADPEIAGVWGYRNDEESVGTLGAQLGSAATATASVTWSTASIGTGDVLRIDDERMVIRARTWVDSGQNLGGAGLDASMADVTVPVSTGSAFGVNEVIQLEAEQLLITAITGNNLTVVRAWNGTVLATHATNVDIYALTGVELERGALGTTAAVHQSAAVIYRHVVPGLVADLAGAEAMNQLQQESGGYGSSRGSGESETPAGVGGLKAIRDSARATYRRPKSWLGV